MIAIGYWSDSAVTSGAVCEACSIQVYLILVPGRAVLGSPFPILKRLLGHSLSLGNSSLSPPPSLQVVTQAQYQAHLESLGILIKAKNFLVFQVGCMQWVHICTGKGGYRYIGHLGKHICTLYGNCCCHYMCMCCSRELWSPLPWRPPEKGHNYLRKSAGMYMYTEYFHAFWYSVGSMHVSTSRDLLHVAVLGRNQTLFRCVFQSHYCVQSALAQNFH